MSSVIEREPSEVSVTISLAGDEFRQLRQIVLDQNVRVGELQLQLLAVHRRVDELSAFIKADALAAGNPNRADQIRELPEDLKVWVPVFLNQEFDDQTFDGVKHRHPS